MYLKLVIKNAKRSAKDYLVYIVTMTICVALFYSFLSISSSYYHPDVGTEYDFRVLGDGMKMSICAITLLLLFLIRYVNNYMLRRRQKEFAVQSIMGMEQKMIGRLFFAETFIMGIAAIGIGIFIGVFCSQFITAMLLTSYGKDYQISWTLFPDTVFLTVGFFVLSFLFIGLFNLYTIRKIKIIDMLTADRENGLSLRKSRQMPVVVVLYEAFVFCMLVTGIQKIYFYYDSRFALPARMMFLGNILIPAITLLWPVLWLTGKKKWGLSALVSGLLACAVFCAYGASWVPIMQHKYFLALGSGTMNQYMMFVIIDLLFFICGVIYLASSLMEGWKAKSPEHRYHNQNLFLLGQITTKLSTTNKTMTLICGTLVVAIFLLASAPLLTGWASGYLDVRSKYDVQIFSRYNGVYEEEHLPRDDYEFVADFLWEHGIKTSYDCTFSLYLPRREDFHQRVKWEFPAVAVSLSDYNQIREMLGYERISLGENEFTTHWRFTATEDDRDEFLQTHEAVGTDAGRLALSGQPFYMEPVGETLFNSYTDVVYVFPDHICQELLSVICNRYIMTEAPVSYIDACELEDLFEEKYPEETDTGASYGIRMNTLQINSAKAGNFVLQASMLYGAVVLMVICFTILSLQQLLDAGHYRYRFSVLRKLGVEEKDIGGLVLKQLGIWFGLPITVAVLAAAVIVAYFIQTMAVEIYAYIGFGALITQIMVTGGILAVLLVCYFISTWLLFRRSV